MGTVGTPTLFQAPQITHSIWQNQTLQSGQGSRMAEFPRMLPSGKWPQGGSRGSVGVIGSGPPSADIPGALVIRLWLHLCQALGQGSSCPSRKRGSESGCEKCMCVCRHAYMCGRLCVHYVRVHVWAWLYVLYAHVCMQPRPCVCTCGGVHMSSCVYIGMDVSMCAYTRAPVRGHAHMHTF